MNPIMTAAFARKLARMHVVDLPLNQKPKDILAKIDILLPDPSTYKDDVESMECTKEEEASRDKLLDFEFAKELAWVKETIKKLKTRQVLGHGDMNKANCLIIAGVEDPTESLMLIDYEVIRGSANCAVI